MERPEEIAARVIDSLERANQGDPLDGYELSMLVRDVNRLLEFVPVDDDGYPLSELEKEELEDE